MLSIEKNGTLAMFGIRMPVAIEEVKKALSQIFNISAESICYTEGIYFEEVSEPIEIFLSLYKYDRGDFAISCEINIPHIAKKRNELNLKIGPDKSGYHLFLSKLSQTLNNELLISIWTEEEDKGYLFLPNGKCLKVTMINNSFDIEEETEEYFYILDF